MSVFATLSVLLVATLGGYLDVVTAYEGIEKLSIMDAPPEYMDQEAIWDEENAVRLVNILRRIGLEQFSETAGRRQRFEEVFDYDKKVPSNYNGYDDKIIYIENPVEAQLPGHRISIRLLREIMIARSLAANLPLTTSSEATTRTLGGLKAAGTAATTGNETTSEPTASATDKPAGPTTDLSAGPTTTTPVGPTTAEPTGPTAAKPAGPAAAKPAGPTTAHSAGPTTTEPEGPTTAEPARPTTAEPGGPNTAKPAVPTTTKPAEPTTTKPADPTTTNPAG